MKEETRRQLDKAAGQTRRKRLCSSFHEMFLKAERGEAFGSKLELGVFKELEKELSEDILANDVAVVVVVATNFVNSGHTLAKVFKGDNVIVQEASKTNDGELHTEPLSHINS